MRKRQELKTERRETRREARELARARPLLPELPQPTRIVLGMGLLFLCLWLPAFATLFR